MRIRNCALVSTILMLLAVGFSEAALLQRRQRDLTEAEVNEDNKDQIPVAVIEVQEPDTIVQSLQVDTAIQTTDNSAAESEQDLELKDALIETIRSLEESSTIPDKLDTQTEIGENINFEDVQPLSNALPTAKQVELLPDLAAEASVPKVTEFVDITAETAVDAVTDAIVEGAVRQATQATPSQSTTPQNFVQFIQSSPIGQFFSQLTGGQQQPAAQTPAGAAGDSPTTPSVPVFLNPGAALTQAQQAVQNAAQSVVNTTSQAFQGLQQFASNIGNQFQSTLSTLSGQNQNAGESTSVRPPGPIQSLINNVVGNPSASTAAPAQGQQGPFQGIISFFQGGQRPQNANAAQNIVTEKPTKVEVNSDAGSILDDKIQNEVVQESEINNEVRNSDETLDSFEESQNGQELIVVNDDSSLRTEQTTTV